MNKLSKSFIQIQMIQNRTEQARHLFDVLNDLTRSKLEKEVANVMLISNKIIQLNGEIIDSEENAEIKSWYNYEYNKRFTLTQVRDIVNSVTEFMSHNEPSEFNAWFEEKLLNYN